MSRSFWIHINTRKWIKPVDAHAPLRIFVSAGVIVSIEHDWQYLLTVDDISWLLMISLDFGLVLSIEVQFYVTVPEGHAIDATAYKVSGQSKQNTV